MQLHSKIVKNIFAESLKVASGTWQYSGTQSEYTGVGCHVSGVEWHYSECSVFDVGQEIDF